MSIIGPDVTLNDPAYIHPSACLYGKIIVGEGASIWPNVVVRAEAEEVRIGKCTNIQDFVMIHIGWDKPTIIGDYCSITHHCTLHGCTIGDNCLIGINSTIMDGCVIGDNCILAGHTFLREGTVIPDNSIVMGTPGVVKKTVNSFVANRANAEFYRHNALAFANGNYRAWTPDNFAAATSDLMTDIQVEFTRQYGDN